MFFFFVPLDCVRFWVLFQSRNLTNSDVCMTASDTSTHTNFGRTSTKSLKQAAEESTFELLEAIPPPIPTW